MVVDDVVQEETLKERLADVEFLAKRGTVAREYLRRLSVPLEQRSELSRRRSVPPTRKRPVPDPGARRAMPIPPSIPPEPMPTRPPPRPPPLVSAVVFPNESGRGRQDVGASAPASSGPQGGEEGGVPGSACRRGSPLGDGAPWTRPLVLKRIPQQNQESGRQVRWSDLSEDYDEAAILPRHTLAGSLGLAGPPAPGRPAAGPGHVEGDEDLLLHMRAQNLAAQDHEDHHGPGSTRSGPTSMLAGAGNAAALHPQVPPRRGGGAVYSWKALAAVAFFCLF